MHEENKLILLSLFNFFIEMIASFTLHDSNYKINGLKWKIHKNDLVYWS